jgi:hypothetical protein
VSTLWKETFDRLKEEDYGGDTTLEQHGEADKGNPVSLGGGEADTSAREAREQTLTLESRASVLDAREREVAAARERQVGGDGGCAGGGGGDDDDEEEEEEDEEDEDEDDDDDDDNDDDDDVKMMRRMRRLR